MNNRAISSAFSLTPTHAVRTRRRGASRAYGRRRWPPPPGEYVHGGVRDGPFSRYPEVAPRARRGLRRAELDGGEQRESHGRCRPWVTDLVRPLDLLATTTSWIHRFQRSLARGGAVAVRRGVRAHLHSYAASPGSAHAPRSRGVVSRRHPTTGRMLECVARVHCEWHGPRTVVARRASAFPPREHRCVWAGRAFERAGVGRPACRTKSGEVAMSARVECAWVAHAAAATRPPCSMQWPTSASGTSSSSSRLTALWIRPRGGRLTCRPCRMCPSRRSLDSATIRVDACGCVNHAFRRVRRVVCEVQARPFRSSHRNGRAACVLEVALNPEIHPQ